MNPSRYCESDLLARFAFEEFGQLAPGYIRVQAINDWVYEHLEYVPGSTNAPQPLQMSCSSVPAFAVITHIWLLVCVVALAYPRVMCRATQLISIHQIIMVLWKLIWAANGICSTRRVWHQPWGWYVSEWVETQQILHFRP